MLSLLSCCRLLASQDARTRPLLLIAAREGHTEALQALAKKVAEDLEVDEKQASYVIRDITIGEDYSFLMDAVRAHPSICPLLVVYRRLLTHYL